MRTFCLLTYITLIAILAVPAFAEWTEAIEGAPVETINVGTETAAPPVEVADESTAAIAEQAQETMQPAEPTPVYTTQTETAPVQSTFVTNPEPPKPSYMVVYKTMDDLRPPSLTTVISDPSVVPEPGSIVALSTGLGGLLLKLRRRRGNRE
ncbi:MAG: PEP-CTERM sorting domain-containing protein [Armatimonadetes bacterium]|nr:PEP-CTERM sorting domain-containing protein [Armatimonadota bacterium]